MLLRFRLAGRALKRARSITLGNLTYTLEGREGKERKGKEKTVWQGEDWSAVLHSTVADRLCEQLLCSVSYYRWSAFVEFVLWGHEQDHAETIRKQNRTSKQIPETERRSEECEGKRDPLCLIYKLARLEFGLYFSRENGHNPHSKPRNSCEGANIDRITRSEGPGAGLKNSVGRHRKNAPMQRSFIEREE